MGQGFGWKGERREGAKAFGGEDLSGLGLAKGELIDGGWILAFGKEEDALAVGIDRDAFAVARTVFVAVVDRPIGFEIQADGFAW